MTFSDCDSCYKFVSCWKKSIIPHVNLVSEKIGTSITTPTSVSKSSSTMGSTPTRRVCTYEPTTPVSRKHISASAIESVPTGKKRPSTEKIAPTSSKKKRGSLPFSNSDEADIDKHIQQHHIGKLC